MQTHQSCALASPRHFSNQINLTIEVNQLQELRKSFSLTLSVPLFPTTPVLSSDLITVGFGAGVSTREPSHFNFPKYIP